MSISARLSVNITTAGYPPAAPVLRDICVATETHDVIAVLGVSGVGKSTLIKAILGLLADDAGAFTGSILFDVAGDALSPDVARRRGLVGLLAHGAGLVPWLTVRANLSLPTLFNRRVHRADSQPVETCLASVGLPATVLAKYPHELSQGTSVRVSLARALLHEPLFLFLDEPFVGLDAANATLVLELLAQYTAAHNCITLAVTHDLQNATRFATDIWYVGASSFEVLQHTTPVPDLLARLQSDSEHLVGAA